MDAPSASPGEPGRGAALQTGYRAALAAGFTHALQIDADGQHDAADAGRFLAAAERDPEALVLGAPIFDETAPRARRWGRWLSRIWVWIETWSLAIADPLCGYRCVPLARAVSVIDAVPCGRHMEFDPEFAVRMVWAGAPVVNVATHVRYPPDGISHFDMLRDNLRISKTHAVLAAGALLRLPRLLVDRRTQEAEPWHRSRERGSIVGMQVVAWIYRHLGRRLARLCVFPIVAYFWLTSPSARHASQRYLRRIAAYPEGARIVGADPGGREVLRHFTSFGLSIFDRIGFWLGRHGDFRFEIEGSAHLDRIAREGRGALVLGSHLGSFDAMRLIGERSPIPVNVLMYTRHAPRINALFERLTASAGMAAPVRVIPIVPGSMEHVVRARACLQRGEVVAILADRLAPSEDPRRACAVKVLGRTARLPIAPFRLASVLDAPLYLMTALRSEGSRYVIHVHELADRANRPPGRDARDEQLRALAQAYADHLTAACLRAPYQWFNFFDFWSDDEVSER